MIIRTMARQTLNTLSAFILGFIFSFYQPISSDKIIRYSNGLETFSKSILFIEL